MFLPFLVKSQKERDTEKMEGSQMELRKIIISCFFHYELQKLLALLGLRHEWPGVQPHNLDESVAITPAVTIQKLSWPQSLLVFE